MPNVFYLEKADLFVKVKRCDDNEPCIHCCMNKERNEVVYAHECDGYALCGINCEAYLVKAKDSEVIRYLSNASKYLMQHKRAKKIIRDLFGESLTQPLPAKLKKQCNKTGRVLRFK